MPIYTSPIFFLQDEDIRIGTTTHDVLLTESTAIPPLGPTNEDKVSFFGASCPRSYLRCRRVTPGHLSRREREEENKENKNGGLLESDQKHDNSMITKDFIHIIRW